ASPVCETTSQLSRELRLLPQRSGCNLSQPEWSQWLPHPLSPESCSGLSGADWRHRIHWPRTACVLPVPPQVGSIHHSLLCPYSKVVVSALFVNRLRVFQHRVDLLPALFGQLTEKAACPAGVTGDATHLFYTVDHGVTVAIQINPMQCLYMTGFFAFSPQTLA